MKTPFLAVGLLAAVLGIGSVNAHAGVPLPAIEQAGGISSLAPILRRTAPAVVSIAIRESANAKASTTAKGMRLQRTAAAGAPDHPFRPSGSGVVIDKDAGLILTNAHVIEGADEIAVTFTDGREAPATRIGADARTDIAVIEVSVEDLPALPAVTMGNSDGIEVGDFVLAVGHPFQIGQTVTSGIISALHRNNVGIRPDDDFIQTDAAIYPGHSGGPLINLRGEIIGINTAFVAAGNTHSGMGFAIPINKARTIAVQLVKKGVVRHGRNGPMF